MIELLSPTDRPRKVDPKKQTVTIYRPGQEPEIRTGVAGINGEGPIEGFVLDLLPVWTL